MSTYIFKDRHFGVSEEGLHFMRSGYNYKTISFAKIQSVRIGKGRAIKNWLLLLAIGILLIGGTLFWGKGILDFLIDANSSGTIYIEEIVGVAFGLFFGLFCIVWAIRTEELIQFILSSKSESFSTKSLRKEGNYDELVEFLKERTLVKEDNV